MFLAIPLTWPHKECDLKSKENNGIYFIAFKRLKHITKMLLHCSVAVAVGGGLNQVLDSSHGPRIRSALIPSLRVGLGCPAASSSPTGGCWVCTAVLLPHPRSQSWGCTCEHRPFQMDLQSPVLLALLPSPARHSSFQSTTGSVFLQM